MYLEYKINIKRREGRRGEGKIIKEEEKEKEMNTYDASSGTSDGVTEGDCSAVDVQLALINPENLNK